jgi:hypothetical protein
MAASSEHDGVVAEYGWHASAVTPTWVDLVDFERRLPDALGGIRPEAEPS